MSVTAMVRQLSFIPRRQVVSLIDSLSPKPPRVSRFASEHAYGELAFVLSGVTPALSRVNVKRVALEDNPCFVAE